MEKFLHASFPEIVFGSSDPAQSQAIRRAVKAGKLHKIAPKIYSSNFKDSPASIIKKHRYQILGQRFSGGVISHRSALEGGVAKDGSIVITYKYTKKITLPGMVIRCVQGKGAQKGDMPFMTHLHLSSRARAFLENMQSGREGESLSKVLTRDKIEKRLIQIIRIHGEEELNHLRDQAKAIAPILKMKKEYQQLATLISAILGTHSHEQLTSTLAKAHATGKPYDPVRIELFADLVAALYAMQPIQRACHLKQAKAKANMAFFEAYFSNYIEGTEFEVNEAYQIVQSNQINIARPEDSHDILSTYAIVSNIKEMQTLPHTAAELIKLLKHRHAILMQARPHAMPGQFKDKINRAGNTVFVHPEEVVGMTCPGIFRPL